MESYFRASLPKVLDPLLDEIQAAQSRRVEAGDMAFPDGKPESFPAALCHNIQVKSTAKMDSECDLVGGLESLIPSY